MFLGVQIDTWVWQWFFTDVLSVLPTFALLKRAFFASKKSFSTLFWYCFMLSHSWRLQLSFAQPLVALPVSFCTSLGEVLTFDLRPPALRWRPRISGTLDFSS